MGDVFITYDEYGQKYIRRIIYLNVLLYVVAAILFVLYMVDALTVVLIAVIATMVSFFYVLYFIHKHPPAEYDEEYLSDL